MVYVNVTEESVSFKFHYIVLKLESQKSQGHDV